MLRSTSYEELNALQKQVFLDLALYLPTCIGSRDEILEWLDMVHGKNTKEAVRTLERRGLIDLSNCKETEDDLMFTSVFQEPVMHDLYYEMACLIVEESESECLFFQDDGSDKVLPPLHSCQKLKRIRFDNCIFTGDLFVHHHFPSVQVLDVRSYAFTDLDLRGAVRLRSLNILSKYQKTSHNIRHLDNCDSLFHLSILSLRDKYRGMLSHILTLPTFDSHIPANIRNRTGVYFPNIRNFIVDFGLVYFNARCDFSSCFHIKKLILMGIRYHPLLPTLKNLRKFQLSCLENDCHNWSVELDFGHKIEEISIWRCQHVSVLRGLNRNCTSLRNLELNSCPALKDVEFLGELASLEIVRLSGLHITTLPKELLKLGKQLQDLRIQECYFIKPEDRIAVLSTPDLPRHSYLDITRDLTAMFPKNVHIQVMEPSIHDIQPPERDLKISDPLGFDAVSQHGGLRWFHGEQQIPLLKLEHWEKILSLVVESKESLHTISELLQRIDIDVLAFVLHLCVGGRHVHLKELLSEPHVVEAFTKAQEPFGLIVLGIAKQHFGANLESHPSHGATIANIVSYTYSEGSCERFLPSFKMCARECAASIALSNAWILEKLPSEVLNQVLDYQARYNAHSCYDGTQELSYVTNLEHTSRWCCYL